MKLLVSKIIRKLKFNDLPCSCYANHYLPDSYHEVCDCYIFCKFPPKGNSFVPVVNPKLEDTLALNGINIYQQENKKILNNL